MEPTRIKIRCPECGQSLQVPAEFAGKKARCPDCQTVCSIPAEPRSTAFSLASPFTPQRDIPAADASATPGSPPASGSGPEIESGAVSEREMETEWSLKTPEGPIYGPVTRTQLDGWVAQGRVSHDCSLRQAGGSWMAADMVYPILRPAPPAPVLSGGSGAGLQVSAAGGLRGPSAWDAPSMPARRQTPPGSAGSPGSVGNSASVADSGGVRGQMASRSAASSQTSTAVLPDRGALILSLAILGWFVCPILSVAAWVMGTQDLEDMHAGRRDPQGQGLTQAGRILGMLHAILLIVTMVVTMFAILLVFGARGGL